MAGPDATVRATSHSIKRGSIVESGMNLPLPLAMAHGNHTSKENDIIYHTVDGTSAVATREVCVAAAPRCSFFLLCSFSLLLCSFSPLLCLQTLQAPLHKFEQIAQGPHSNPALLAALKVEFSKVNLGNAERGQRAAAGVMSVRTVS